MSLVGAEAKAERLNTQKKKLDEVMKKTQDIIDQMLPKQISAVRIAWCHKAVFLDPDLLNPDPAKNLIWIQAVF